MSPVKILSYALILSGGWFVYTGALELNALQLSTLADWYGTRGSMLISAGLISFCLGGLVRLGRTP